MARRPDKNRNNPRLAALRAVLPVLEQGRSLSATLPPALADLGAPADRALAQALAYGVLRWQSRLAALRQRLLRKPLKERDADIGAALLLGLHQLAHTRIPAHAAVSETVALTEALGKGWARGLVNAVLRNYQRQAAELEAQLESEPALRTAHPPWLVAALREAWPEHWEAILTANNRQAPLTLRVNARRGDRAGYREQLAAAGIEAHPAPHTEAGLILAEPVAVESLPGFAQGAVSVQDAAAQLAAVLLDARAGERVLDACAAPGGKTAHILERTPGLAGLWAVDRDPERLAQVRENLTRLELPAHLVEGDAADPQPWWDGEAFDRILVDAPCTATGVIRRHPDIKLLRRAGDVAMLAARQRAILEGLWPLLRRGGMLLYATCSVLPAENTEQVLAFQRAHADAHVAPITADWGHATEAGRQILPGEDDMDGFYYACLVKR